MDFKLYDYIKLLEDKKVDSKMVFIIKDYIVGGIKVVVEFIVVILFVLENEKKVCIGIRRYGKMDIFVIVW